ncbi:hypothetical protein GH714_000614 [Hevea brasiliensis]|uniref:Germin-like protein n=1 Tax=Hevea brasiliensis TaxID=3981 RepID=A0A6A6KJ59_HEVBR|nr:hypothetical protein GH714_000614 [Hevea brasiliensis]
MEGTRFLAALAVLALALAFSLASADDPSPLQDFCVAMDDPKNVDILFVNRKFCKNPNLTVADDFSFSGLNITENRVGSNVALMNVDKIPRLNTLGISLAQLDLAHNGDVFVFPIGLIHFQFNVGKTNAVAFVGLSSQNPSVVTIANALFASNPPINPDVLVKAF